MLEYNQFMNNFSSLYSRSSCYNVSINVPSIWHFTASSWSGEHHQGIKYHAIIDNICSPRESLFTYNLCIPKQACSTRGTKAVGCRQENERTIGEVEQLEEKL